MSSVARRIRAITLTNRAFARWITGLVLTSSILAPGAALANTARELDPGVIARIRGARSNQKIVLPNVVLSDTETRTIEIEEFSVYTPDAAILVYDTDPPRRIAPPARRYFKGRVADDPTATVFFSVSTNSSEVEGLIVIGERKFVIASGRRLARQQREKSEREAPILVAEIDPLADGVDSPPFECATENLTIPVARLPFHPKPVTLAVTATSYELRIAIETDNEFHLSFGGPGAATDAAVNTYIGNLVAQASVIYMRDLQTKLNIGQVNIRPSDVPDDFVATGTAQTLWELGGYWHANYPAVPRSATVMLSGRVSGGAAWTDRLCDIDRYCGTTCDANWSGAYAVNGTIGETTVPNPNATVDGIVYGLPGDYWMLQGFAHELGHVIGSEHTQCTGLTPEEKTLYSVTRDFVDECWSSSTPFGCYSGATPSVPPEKGTIMSYCYLQTRPSTGYPESRYVFGEAGFPSQKMLEILSGALEYALPTGTITVGSNLACAAGQTASEAAGCVAGCTFSWAISGGSIQGSATTSSISFTPSAAMVTLTLSVTNEKGCKITTSFATTSQCATTLGAPTNLVATATTSTSVNLWWTAVADAATYEVERSANTVVYVPIGAPAGTALTDSNAVAGTSYLYRVRAVDAGANSGPWSPTDLATTIIFTDDPITPGSTLVKGIHLTQLRTAVNATRVLAQLGPATFTDSISPILQIKKIHIDELRINLDAFRAALGWSLFLYIDPLITTASTTVKAAHFNELRNGVK